VAPSGACQNEEKIEAFPRMQSVILVLDRAQCSKSEMTS
jgi:hypothetical protein